MVKEDLQAELVAACGSERAAWAAAGKQSKSGFIYIGCNYSCTFCRHGKSGRTAYPCCRSCNQCSLTRETPL